MQNCILYIKERKRNRFTFCQTYILPGKNKSNSSDTHFCTSILLTSTPFRNQSAHRPMYTALHRECPSVVLFPLPHMSLARIFGFCLSGFYRPTRLDRETGTARFRRGSLLSCFAANETLEGTLMKQGLNDNHGRVA